jgi:hypothetical protein
LNAHKPKTDQKLTRAHTAAFQYLIRPLATKVTIVYYGDARDALLKALGD